jgi:hypothetical protein
MKLHCCRGAFGGLWLATAGCSFFVPDTKTSADHARAIEPKCAPGGTDTERAAISADIVESVEPSYAHVLGGPNRADSRLRGARLHLRPLPGASPESLTRDLECHQARVTLGREVATEADPYVLPGRWMTIDVRSEHDGWVVLVESDDHDDAVTALERARRFVAARR